MELDDYCAERHIDLVPSLASFGNGSAPAPQTMYVPKVHSKLPSPYVISCGFGIRIMIIPPWHVP